MNAHSFFPTLPVWHGYHQATLRIECELSLRNVYVQLFEAEITVYEDPTDGDQWHIGEMSIVGSTPIAGTNRWQDKLIPVERHPRGGQTEEGWWATAIERAAELNDELIVETLSRERVS